MFIIFERLGKTRINRLIKTLLQCTAVVTQYPGLFKNYEKIPPFWYHFQGS